MSRLSPLTEADLSAEQQAVLDAIRTGPRGSRGLGGPFGVYARAPSIGHEAQALGAAVRFRASELAENVKEVAICTVGAFFHSKFEFAAHAALAQKAGVDGAVVEALRTGTTPEFTDTKESTAHRIAATLLREHRIPDALYAEGRERFGETGMIELVTTVGYYSLVSFTLNTFQVPLADDMRDPFPDVRG
jgi:4-carboxymuconolactone decarboxylase